MQNGKTYPCQDEKEPNLESRSSLSPMQGELPPLDIIKEDRERSYSENSGWDTTLFCRERQLRAAYAEIERLKGELEHRRTEVSALNEALTQAESETATSHSEVERLKGKLAPFVENSVIADCILCRTPIWARQERIDNGSGLAHATCAFNESGKQEGRKEALDAVRGCLIKNERSMVALDINTGIRNAEQAILALPKVGE